MADTNYRVNDRVAFYHRTFDNTGTVETGWLSEMATVTRVWGNNVTLVTDSGQTYTRRYDSESMVKQRAN
jgi:hypothetical protein